MAWERYRITYLIKLSSGLMFECRQFTNLLESGEYILKCMEEIDTIKEAKIEERITDGLREEWEDICSWTKLEEQDG